MVYFDRFAMRWEAMFDGRFLGSFGSEEDAEAAVAKAKPPIPEQPGHLTLVAGQA